MPNHLYYMFHRTSSALCFNCSVVRAAPYTAISISLTGRLLIRALELKGAEKVIQVQRRRDSNFTPRLLLKY